MTLTVQDAHGDARERRLHMRAMQEGGLNRALVRVLSPAEMAGQSFLFVENDGDSEDDVWVFLPALDDEPRRISGTQKNEPFMGSNITYADMESRDIRDGTYVRLADEDLSGFPVYVIDATAPDSDYERIRMWIRQSDFIPLRIRFFGSGDTVIKTLFTEEVNEQQGRTYVQRMTMVDADELSTTMVIESIDFEADVSPTEFTRENLVR
jgi:outer membrane lipoprotein-sorting protein